MEGAKGEKGAGFAAFLNRVQTVSTFPPSPRSTGVTPVATGKGWGRGISNHHSKITGSFCQSNEN